MSNQGYKLIVSLLVTKETDAPSQKSHYKLIVSLLVTKEIEAPSHKSHGNMVGWVL